MPDSSINDTLSDFLLAQRVLFDLSARLIREAEAEQRRSGLAMKDTPRLARSLESLISEGNRYGTIYAAPPWPCEQYAEPGSFFWRQPTSFDALAEMPVHRLAAPSSHLHIWAPATFWLHARAIIEKWGFTYKSALVWIRPHFRDGDCWGFSQEYLLLGTRGNDLLTDYRPRTWFIEAPCSLRPESRPAAIDRLIERISPGPRLRLFAQVQREGWTSWEGPSPTYPVVDVDDDDFVFVDDDDKDCDAIPIVQQDLAADSPLIIDLSRQTER